jgi:ribosomal protein S18 acetylase RimI-like enzyme
MEYELRKADKQDQEKIVCLYLKAIADMIKSGVYQWDEIYPNEEVLTEDIDRGEMYVLTDGNFISACVVINEEQDISYLPASWHNTEGRFAVIHRLCVHPDFQGKGIGKKTMQLAQEMLKREGFLSIRLDTFSKNPIARRMYEHLGFSYVGEVTFRKGLFYLMEKALAE